MECLVCINKSTFTCMNVPNYIRWNVKEKVKEMENFSKGFK